jgi:hypothetical protein
MIQFFSLLFFSFRNYIHINILYALRVFLLRKKGEKKQFLTSHGDIISIYSHLFSFQYYFKNCNFRIYIAISEANP